MSNFDVIVFGTVCLDAMWRVEKLPPPGGYQHILEERKMLGGEAANTAMALAKWGVRVALVGTALGDDEDGLLLREKLNRDASDIDTSCIITIPGERTPYCVCIATPDGHRTMFGRGFSAMQCANLEPDFARGSKFFTMEPNAFQAGKDACMTAIEAGLQVVAMDYTREEEVNRAASISVTSHEHIGVDRSGEEYARAAAELRDRHGNTFIVTCGDRGCFVAARSKLKQKAEHVPAYTISEVVDSTGAGDIFRAGLLYGELQQWDTIKTVKFASAAAALNCTALGGWGGIRFVSEVFDFQKAASSL